MLLLQVWGLRSEKHCFGQLKVYKVLITALLRAQQHVAAYSQKNHVVGSIVYEDSRAWELEYSSSGLLLPRLPPWVSCFSSLGLFFPLL